MDSHVAFPAEQALPQPEPKRDVGEAGAPAGDAVTVCICTFRRPSLRHALEGVAAQILPSDASFRILVIDNDVGPTASNIVAHFRADAGIDVEYRHAPAQNISIARNAGLDAATTPWLAFLDDDEYASAHWLGNLFAARNGANAIFGPCEAIYGKETPSWIRKGDYHSNRLPTQGGPIDTGYTSNVLIDMDFVRRCGLRFDEALGRTGGEDTMFFHAMYRKGGALAYSADAVVSEHVVASRLNLRWIVTRKYRAGQVYAMMLSSFDAASYRRAFWTAPLKIAACAVISAVTAFRADRAMWWLMRGVFHAGVLSYLLGARVCQEYRS
jgi:succinoglycan biosynthesis protein ExoM